MYRKKIKAKDFFEVKKNIIASQDKRIEYFAIKSFSRNFQKGGKFLELRET
jgi:hypothetical protein